MAEKREKNITERKKVEEEQAESRKNFKSLFNAMVDPVAIVDTKGRILEITDKAEEIIGIKKEELLGKNFMRAKIPFTTKSKALMIKLFITSIGIKIPPFEVEALTKDGKKIPFEVNSADIEYMGKPAIMVVFRDITKRKRAEEELRKHREHLEDLVEKRTTELKRINEELQLEITERKRAEEALQESEEKFRLAYENAKDAIFWADPKTGLITNCNKAAEILLEKKGGEIVGYHQRTLHPPQKAEYYANMFKKHIEQKGAADDEAEVITKSGKIKPVHITASVTIVGGKPIIQGIFRDITERKKAENRIKMEREVYQSIARAANQSRTVKELCELALKGVQRAIKYDMADVLVYRESENALFSAAQFGYPEDLYQRTIKRQDMKEESRVAAQAVRKRKSIYIDDMKMSKFTSYARDLIVKYDISTLYAVPLFNRGKLQGVLEVLTTGDGKLSKEDCEVLDTISEELAGGIAKAKIEEKLVTVKEAFGWIAQS